MSPLSVRDIEELRDRDWIYVINLEMAAREGLVGNLSKCGTYVMVNKLVDQETGTEAMDFRTAYHCVTNIRIDSYGVTWMAYRNKEEFSLSEDILHLPAINEYVELGTPKAQVIYRGQNGGLYCTNFESKKDAEAWIRLNKLIVSSCY